MEFRKVVGVFINPWVIGGTLVVGVLLLTITFALLWTTRSDSLPARPVEAVFTIIPAPIETLLLPTPTQPEPQISPSDQQVGVGGYIKVNGTGGDGLRLRYNPGIKAQVHVLAAEGEKFQVRDGPVESDDYIWWYLVGLQDEQRYGWAVSNFLQVTQNP
jgi:hypothetical protein